VIDVWSALGHRREALIRRFRDGHVETARSRGAWEFGRGTSAHPSGDQAARGGMRRSEPVRRRGVRPASRRAERRPAARSAAEDWRDSVETRSVRSRAGRGRVSSGLTSSERSSTRSAIRANWVGRWPPSGGQLAAARWWLVGMRRRRRPTGRRATAVKRMTIGAPERPRPPPVRNRGGAVRAVARRAGLARRRRAGSRDQVQEVVRAVRRPR